MPAGEGASCSPVAPERRLVQVIRHIMAAEPADARGCQIDPRHDLIVAAPDRRARRRAACWRR
jgi:hypothetical protein